MSMRIALIVGAVALASAAAADPQQATPQQMEERARQLEESSRHARNTISVAEQIKALLEVIVAEKKMHCVNSVGNSEFCTCIANSIPTDVSFLGYISATSFTNEELHYSSLSPDERKAIDNSRAGRVKCLGILP